MENTKNYEKRIIDSIVKTSRLSINKLIETIAYVEQSPVYRDDPMIQKLIFRSYKLLTQNLNISYLGSDSWTGESNLLADIPQTVKSIAEECSVVLKPIQREVQTVIKCTDSTARINEKAFVLIMGNLLQNALLYSPLKSPVIVVVENEDGCVSVSVTNIAEINTDRNEEEKAGLGLPLCAKISEQMGGKFNYFESEGKIITKLSLPIENDKTSYQKLVFKSAPEEYIYNKYRPITMFMNEVLTEQTIDKI
jgi:light-regulated signal transduction histidine kinase (bacteriophytochrome)